MLTEKQTIDALTEAYEAVVSDLIFRTHQYYELLIQMELMRKRMDCVGEEDARDDEM